MLEISFADLAGEPLHVGAQLVAERDLSGAQRRERPAVASSGHPNHDPPCHENRGGEEKKEQEKLDKFMGKYKNENDQDRTRRLAQKERRREEGRAFVLDIINAYNFTNAGEEAVDGRETFVIVADPRNDFRPAQPHADVLRKLRGKIRIDQKNYGWVKVEAEAIDTISWGFFVLRIHKGSRIAFEQTRVNDEIWLPKRVAVNAGARFALLMNETFDWEATYSNYKKFTSSVRVLAGPGEVQR